MTETHKTWIMSGMPPFNPHHFLFIQYCSGNRSCSKELPTYKESFDFEVQKSHCPSSLRKSWVDEWNHDTGQTGP